MKLPATKTRKSGIALAVTMLVLSVMTLVSVAFFQSYQSHFSITRSSRSSETAAAGCEAVFDYVTYRLEHDRGWGSGLFEEVDNEKDPLSPLVEIESMVGTHNFRGRIVGSNTTVTGTIYNNFKDLGHGGEDPALYPPSETAHGFIECKNGDSVRRVEFMVREAPLFDSSALSRTNLKVDAQSLTLESNDSSRNMLRAEQDIYVPDVLTGDGRTKFFLPGTSTPDNNGMIWAKGAIHSLVDSSSFEELDEADELAKAAQTSHGKFIPNAESHFSLQELDSEVFEVPETHTTIPLEFPSLPTPPGVSSLTGVNAAGQFNFTRRAASVTVAASYHIPNDNETKVFSDVVIPNPIYIDLLEYYAPGTSPETGPPTAVFRAKERTEDIMATGHIPEQIMESDGFWDWPDQGNFTGLEATNVSIDIPGYSGGVRLLGSEGLVFGDNDAENLTFDLVNQSVTATQNALVDVNGPFKITSTAHDNVPVPPPVLNLGYDTTVGNDGKVAKAIIRANDSIEIRDGVTQGLGGLISKNGDVVIQPKDTPEVLVDGAAAGMMVFAGGNVELANPNSETDWTFRGLVYARGGIRMDGANTDGERADATFEGSLVALQAFEPEGGPNGIELLNCNDIKFTYSKEMLEANVAKLKGERTQIEVVYWRD
ncbi:MAG: hypothetical protein WC314_06960 [Vulcanimicrobiota bacterium]